MSVTISLTETAILGALRTVLLGMLPAGIEVIRAEINRVPEPVGADFVLMSPILHERLATNIVTWFDGFFSVPPVPGVRMDLQPIKLTVQLDVHGPASADNTQIITTLFRGEVATAAFDALSIGVQTLYAEDARQSPFTNEADQVEFRWTIDLALQANPIVISPQDFAAQLHAGLISADATYSL